MATSAATAAAVAQHRAVERGRGKSALAKSAAIRGGSLGRGAVGGHVGGEPGGDCRRTPSPWLFVVTPSFALYPPPPCGIPLSLVLYSLPSLCSRLLSAFIVSLRPCCCLPVWHHLPLLLILSVSFGLKMPDLSSEILETDFSDTQTEIRRAKVACVLKYSFLFKLK